MVEQNKVSRRRFAAGLGVAAAAGLAGSVLKGQDQGLHIASNSYSWTVFYQREGKDFMASLKTALGDVRKSGLNGYEPGIGSPADLDRLAPLLKEHGLEIRSLYVNSTLHEKSDVDQSVGSVMKVAEKAKDLGTRIIVTNPSPIRWGGEEAKSDKQLRTQAAALNELGQKLADLGLVLAYHNHDAELRHAAREFHHMMVGTDPRLVTLCLDFHWVYRGAGNSSVALSDIVQLYGSRISELHLRQSRGGVWAETFAEGDLDYPALARQIRSFGVKPHLVMEIAVEEGTPKTMDPVEAHRRSAEYARRVFAGYE
jgi:inosose dehydratase